MPEEERERQRLSNEERRQQILAVAKEVLLESGYAEMTMERIGEAAGVSKTLIYHHFPNRRAIFLALLTEEQLKILMKISPALSAGGTEERVKQGIKAFLDAVSEYGPRGYTALYRDPVGYDITIAMEVDRYREKIAEMIAGIFAEEAGVPIDELLLPAHAVVGAINNSVIWMSQNGEKAMNDPRTVETLTTLIWDGLKVIRENLLQQRKQPSKS